MAEGWISLFKNPNTEDGNSGMVPYSAVHGSSPDQDPMVGVMHESNDSAFKDVIRIPPDFSSTPVGVIEWTSETVGGDVVHEWRHRVADAGEALDISTSPTELTSKATHTADLSATSVRVTTEISLTGTDWVAKGLLYIEMWRLAASDAADTKADKITIWVAGIKYTTV